MPLLFNFILEVLAKAIGHKKRNKGIQIGKGKVELSLPANDNTLYIDKPEAIHKKIWKSKFSEDELYKINMQKKVVFLYTSNE